MICLPRQFLHFQYCDQFFVPIFSYFSPKFTDTTDKKLLLVLILGLPLNDFFLIVGYKYCFCSYHREIAKIYTVFMYRTKQRRAQYKYPSHLTITGQFVLETRDISSSHCENFIAFLWNFIIQLKHKHR